MAAGKLYIIYCSFYHSKYHDNISYQQPSSQYWHRHISLLIFNLSLPSQPNATAKTVDLLPTIIFSPLLSLYLPTSSISPSPSYFTLDSFIKPLSTFSSSHVPGYLIAFLVFMTNSNWRLCSRVYLHVPNEDLVASQTNTADSCQKVHQTCDCHSGGENWQAACESVLRQGNRLFTSLATASCIHTASISAYLNWHRLICCT